MGTRPDRYGIINPQRAWPKHKKSKPKHIFIQIVQDSTKDHPLHYVRTGIQPELMDPVVMDNLPQPTRSPLVAQFYELLDTLVASPYTDISKKDIEIFLWYMRSTNKPALISKYYKVSINYVKCVVTRLKQIVYVHFSEDFGIRRVPIRWKVAKKPELEIDAEGKFIPGGKYRS